jgi:phosphate transport system protein
MERVRFDEDLRALGAAIARMGELAEARLDACLRALAERDPDLADAVVGGDGALNDLQLDVDGLAVRLLALQQPAARDLRFITSAVKANADLERVGDHAVNVAQTTRFLVRQDPLGLEPVIDRMGRTAIRMMHDAVASFLERRPELAREVCARDDEVDELRNEVFRALLARMVADPLTVERGVSLMLVSRNFERVADHATNIAEDAIFLVEARDVRHPLEPSS